LLLPEAGKCAWLSVAEQPREYGIPLKNGVFLDTGGMLEYVVKLVKLACKTVRSLGFAAAAGDLGFAASAAAAEARTLVVRRGG